MTSEDNAPNSPNLGITCASRSQRVQPGEQAVYFVQVENRSSEAQTQSIVVRGLDSGWCNLEFDARERMFPRDQRSATLVVAVPRGAAPQQQSFQIVVLAGTWESAVVCTLDVLAPEVSVAPPVSAEPASRAPSVDRRPISPGIVLSPEQLAWDPVTAMDAKLIVTIRNVDTVEMDYSVAVEDLAPSWVTPPPVLRVAGGESGEAVVRIRPPAATRPGEFAFKLRVSVNGSPDVGTEGRSRLTITAEPKHETPPAQPATVAPAPPLPPEQVVMPPVVSLLPSSLAFIRGQFNGRMVVKVQNKSNLLEHYVLSLDGLPEDWYTFVTGMVTLEPGKSQDIPLTIAPRPRAGFPPGNYRFRVRAAPHRFPDSFDESGGEITMETDPPRITALLEPAQGEGRKEKFKLTLSNVGNVATNVWMEGSDPEGACKFKFPPSPNLQPGDQAVIPVWVGAKRNGILGQPETFDFHMRVSPAGGMQQDIQSFNARLVHHPFLGFRFAGISIFLAAVVSVIGIVVSLGPSTVVDASHWIGCGFDDKYQKVKGGPLYIKRECGGALEAAQHPEGVGQGVASQTPSATAQPTAPLVAPPGEPACVSALGIVKGKTVQSLPPDGVVIRQDPGGQRVGNLAQGETANVTGGCKAASALIWWEIKADRDGHEGWVAETDPSGEKLLQVK